MKTLREKEKLLVMNNFSFSHSVFSLFGELSAIFNKFESVICELFFSVEESKICRLGKAPFPHSDTFWHPWETSLLKTSNFSFSHSVFYLFG